MRLVPIAAYKLIKILEKIGFERIRQTGSHIVLRHPDGRTTVIPLHSIREIGPNLLNQILKQAKITREEFFRIIKEILVLLGISTRTGQDAK